ncbi:hypothetical protein E2C00_01980 [Streptomyces sp. WAC05374]|uniref:hypothetical protein n=1 Tax=unclassified Streptomyces TaxID=2593676 RepID=UPI000F8649F4|nr:hypothetical protein [Streptomyces sp. WAC05374]RST15567.1 hypothetical protein EF905_14685 [Streptomyces sp. WAC05374]TDF50300.1 hypothetical protein E2B92_01955 [Streptomyces sp. WAC05374]TDF58024.1 hypothetical protein E2C02_09745 [Streptomyces sp. WAC05374]TDF60552.1 hypothetical protein E2C00_01980 [Streptomyces sp. WAC05374]
MTKTQRLLTALVVAAGASALSAPSAGAVIVPAPGPQGPSLLNRVDDLASIAVAPEHRSKVPTVTEQFGGLDGLQRLGEARQLIEPVAPVLWLLPLG